MAETLERDRARLLEVLTQRSFERRRVVLSSGKESDFYIDCKRTALLAEGHYLIGRLLLEAIRRDAPSAVAAGGLTLGADPLASAVSLTSFLEGGGQKPLHAFIVRKEPKGHGTGQWIEGLSALSPGAPVAIVEDVVTTGASTIKAIERAKLEGLTVLGAFALVDRLEGGREAVESAGHRLTTLFTRKDFIP
ncbi:orotate phosphoribosyltransferase [Corallococcus exiguus]|uniref:Orotate phosphoribosyltransferase n=1 Tax=Corallococcus exiguus TaxID=83462 RepID=A0A7Y1X009_9BACT|nr:MULTISPECIES: orotate phosphoribosyltransferase [Corallococcus]RKI26524.1 orotate phosphoribosyltransferase [Corallococcus sp. AB004]NBC39849.1 orotate phosphoribosyltransferase [Corallococcus exiguus]NNC22173.1 orotate phosphoribosyltransferase [Corallococcus exiguus]NPC76254.1 orotate phosphoribosyltransferase [Corallococcus exiguus]NPD26150.1 orotate phosphoribosyltransferase [Corallococcus exiguus]